MATPQRWSEDLLVSGIGDNDEPQVAALADGRFVVTWVDNTAQEIRAQILNADGSLHGSQFTVNSNPVAEQMHPNVTALSDGRFVVIWTDQSDPKYDNNNTTSGMAGQYADIYGQVFNIDGSKSGAAFQVNGGVPPTHAGHQPGVTALNGGGFAVTWRDYLTPDDQSPGSGGPTAEIWLARHDSNGTQVLGPTRIDYSTNYADVEPVVEELDTGNLVVAWSQGTVTNEINLLARIVDASGNTVADLGDIGAAYAGTPNVVQILPEITKLQGGGFVVTWKVEDGSTGAHDYAVWGRVFNDDGSPRTDAFRTSVPQGVEVDPVVTALADGRFMITWADYNAYGALSTEVKSQVYDAAGVPSGEAFTIHTPDRVNDRMPSITTLEDGRVVISWWHDEGFQPTIRAQIVDPRESGITLEGTAHHDDYVGTDFSDILSGLQGNDRFDGGAAADLINGGDGFDFVAFSSASSGVAANLSGGFGGDAAGDVYTSIEGLIGSRFNDTFYGNGAAVLQGGAGNDTYVVKSGDQVVEAVGGGYDTVIFSGSFVLSAGTEIEALRFSGVSSRKAANLTGSDSANVLTGHAGKNTLKGMGGNDVLKGGLGNDVLYGNAGKDAFVFNTKPHKSKNLDKIGDFKVKDDAVWLDNAVFKALGKWGSEAKPAKLKSAYFYKGTAAHDANDRVIYDKKAGALYYDADGTGAAAQVKIATLTKNLKMTAADFFVI